MRAQTILFLLVDRVREKLDCRPYRGSGEGNPKRLGEVANLAFSKRSNIFTIRPPASKTRRRLVLMNHSSICGFFTRITRATFRFIQLVRLPLTTKRTFIADSTPPILYDPTFISLTHPDCGFRRGAMMALRSRTA